MKFAESTKIYCNQINHQVRHHKHNDNQPNYAKDLLRNAQTLSCIFGTALRRCHANTILRLAVI